MKAESHTHKLHNRRQSTAAMSTNNRDTRMSLDMNMSVDANSIILNFNANISLRIVCLILVTTVFAILIVSHFYHRFS